MVRISEKVAIYCVQYVAFDTRKQMLFQKLMCGIKMFKT